MSIFSCQGNPKTLWTGIIHKSESSECKYVATKITSNNIDVIELKVIANIFNSYLAKTVPSTDTTPDKYLSNHNIRYVFPISNISI